MLWKWLNAPPTRRLAPFWMRLNIQDLYCVLHVSVSRQILEHFVWVVILRSSRSFSKYLSHSTYLTVFHFYFLIKLGVHSRDFFENPWILVSCPDLSGLVFAMDLKTGVKVKSMALFFHRFHGFSSNAPLFLLS